MPFLCHFNIINIFFFYLSRDKGLAISQVIVLNKLFILARYLTVKKALESGNTLLIALWNIRFLAKQCILYTIWFLLLKYVSSKGDETRCCSYRNSAD